MGTGRVHLFLQRGSKGKWKNRRSAGSIGKLLLCEITNKKSADIRLRIWKGMVSKCADTERYGILREESKENA